MELAALLNLVTGLLLCFFSYQGMMVAVWGVEVGIGPQISFLGALTMIVSGILYLVRVRQAWLVSLIGNALCWVWLHKGFFKASIAFLHNEPSYGFLVIPAWLSIATVIAALLPQIRIFLQLREENADE